MTVTARWPASRSLRAVPALVLGALFLWLGFADEAHVPGHRGAQRLTEGFRPGRWDARFVVARGPAALALPAEPSDVVLSLSGPARVRVGGDLEARVWELTAGAQPQSLALPRGGRVTLQADAPVRLHELRVRGGRAATSVLLPLAVLTIAAAALAVWRPGPWPALASALIPLAGWWLARGTLMELRLAAWFDRLLPVALAVGAASTFLLLLVFSRTARTKPAALPAVPLIFGGALFLSCIAQLSLFPQPLLIGDPAAYHDMGGRFVEAIRSVRSLDDAADALQTLRPYGGLVFVSTAYGFLRALHDHLATIYVAQALALGGAGFFLTRAAGRLGGDRLQYLTGVLALGYATFPVLAGIVQPEPFILLAWTFAFDRVLRASSPADPRGMASAGLAFAVGLALHPQGIWFLLVAFVLVLAPFARPLLARHAPALRAFALGMLPVVIVTAAGEAYARPVTPVLDERHGFWAYTAPFPLGFWLFLDTDGWQGPVRVDDTRYARELRGAEAAGASDGAGARLVFTARFVAENAAASARTVLRNLHRLFHVPDNPGRRDYPIPYPWQVWSHRALVVLFLLGVVTAARTHAILAYVPFAMLCLTYPLYHVFNKYAVPATPFLLLGAALALLRLAEQRALPLVVALAAAGIGAAVPPAWLVEMGVPALAAKGLLLVLHLAGLAAAFLFAAATWTDERAVRVLAVVAAGALIVPAIVARGGDPGWTSFARSLEVPVTYRLHLSPEERARLAGAREAYLVADLKLAGGDASGVTLRFATGATLPGTELRPCMPTFGLATTRFQRDPATFRQWWRVPWRPEMAAPDGSVSVTLEGRREDRVFGQLGDDASHGFSLGEWPRTSVYRLMHDDEYRLPAAQPTGGTARTSLAAGKTLPGVLGMRVVAMAEPGAVARVEIAPVPAVAKTIVTALWARTSPVGRATLRLGETAVEIDLGRRGTVAQWPRGEVRFVATGDAEGWFLVKMPATPAPLEIAFDVQQEMASPARFVAPELRTGAPIPLDWTGFPYVPVVKVLESRTTPWAPAVVF